jgi:rSAM/selenodomain-associated transferase 1
MRRANPEPAGRVGVAIFARAPVAGQVKTRLIPLLGEEGAAGLQAWMLQRTVATALEANVGPVTLWCEGDTGQRDVSRCRELGPLRIRPQVAGDLGRRMLAAVEESPTAAGTLVIGTDCPVLGVAHLREAARSLADHDSVLIPVEDGGYVLIGMKRPSAAAFAGIDWGTPQVMAQTRRSLAALGWRWAELASLWDVDRPEDVERLAAMFPELGEMLGRKQGVA